MKPGIWIAGWSEPMAFKDLSLQYIHVGVRLGVGTDNINRNRGVALIDFDNVNILTPPDAFDGGCGPAVDAGYAYWINFRRCSIMAYHGASLEDDRRAAMLLKADGSAPGTWLIEDCRFGGGGGVKYDPSGATSGWGAITMSDVLVESNWEDASAPAFWISAYKSLGFGMFLKNLSIADDGPGTPASVKIAAGISPEVVVAINVGRVSGPATLIGSSYPAEGLSMAAHHQIGLTTAGQSGANRFAGGVNSSRFQVEQLAAQFQYPTQGYPPTSYGTVVVSEVDGPIGLPAYRLTSTLAPFNRDRLLITGIHGALFSPAVGDMYIVGCWVRAPNGFDLSHPDAPLIYVGFNDNNGTLNASNYYTTAAPPGDSSWRWVTVTAKVTTLTVNPPGPIMLAAWMYPDYPLDIFQPTVYRLAAGTYNESDILDWAQSIVPMPPGSTPGNSVLLPGQNLEFGQPSGTSGPQITMASAAPASGAWMIGSMAFNTAPASGQPRGWVCTVSGTPGTWISMGAL
jgi:hypothetical protein